MVERPVLVGVIPQVVVLDDGDQIAWLSDAGAQNSAAARDARNDSTSGHIILSPALSYLPQNAS